MVASHHASHPSMHGCCATCYDGSMRYCASQQLRSTCGTFCPTSKSRRGAPYHVKAIALDERNENSFRDI
eukprot:SAG31_NODE_1776_length_7300_cov_10.281905_4_plen_70_part_00